MLTSTLRTALEAVSGSITALSENSQGGALGVNELTRRIIPYLLDTDQQVRVPTFLVPATQKVYNDIQNLKVCFSLVASSSQPGPNHSIDVCSSAM